MGPNRNEGGLEGEDSVLEEFVGGSELWIKVGDFGRVKNLGPSQYQESGSLRHLWKKGKVCKRVLIFGGEESCVGSLSGVVRNV